MSFWDILGIPPASDLSAVKKAYAKKLRIHHPEDDPEGYQRLREAYDAAVKAIKAAERRRAGPPEQEAAAGRESVVWAQHGEQEGDHQPPPRVRLPEAVPVEREDGPRGDAAAVDALFEGLHLLYGDFSRRTDPANWEKLLESGLLWNLRLMETVRHRMIYFLQNHFLLSRAVWELLDGIFQWKEWEEELRKRYPSQLLDPVFLRHTGEWELRYDFIIEDRVANGDVDSFLKLRRQAFWALQENDVAEAEACIDQALALFGEDPDLLRLQAEVLERRGSIVEALNVYGRMVKLDPKNEEFYFRRARLSRTAGREAAMADCRAVLALEPDHTAALALLAACCAETGDHAAAKEHYLRLIRLVPDHFQARLYLSRQEGLPAKTLEQADVKLYKRRWNLRDSALLLWKLLRVRALSYLLGLVLVQLFAGLAWQPLGISDIANAGSRSHKPPAVTEEEATIRSADDWQRLWTEGSKVRVELPENSYIASMVLYQVHLAGKTLYVTKEEGERMGAFDNQSFNYVYIGLVQGKAIAMVIDKYEDAKAIFNNEALNLKGKAEPMPADLYNSLLARMLTKQVKLPEGGLVRDLYLDNTQADWSESDTLLLSSCIAGLQLVLAYLFLHELWRIGRAIGMTGRQVRGKERAA